MEEGIIGSEERVQSKVGCDRIYYCPRSNLLALGENNPNCTFAKMDYVGDIDGNGNEWWVCKHAQAHVCGGYVCKNDELIRYYNRAVPTF